MGYAEDKSLNAGRHACVGKQLSLAVWKHLADAFNGRRMLGHITDYTCNCTHSFNFVEALGCRGRTFSPSCRQIRSTRLSLTTQPDMLRRRAAIFR